MPISVDQTGNNIQKEKEKEAKVIEAKGGRDLMRIPFYNRLFLKFKLA